MSGHWATHDLPEAVLDAQRRWDIRHRARIARVYGKATYTQIARGLGLSASYVAQLVRTANRDIQFKKNCPAYQYVIDSSAGYLTKIINQAGG